MTLEVVNAIAVNLASNNTAEQLFKTNICLMTALSRKHVFELGETCKVQPSTRSKPKPDLALKF